jgi:hypothetical protein
MAEAAPDKTEESRGGRFWGWVLGAISLVGGLTWILLNLAPPVPAVDIAVGVVVALGGLVLLMPHRVRLPRRPGWLVALGAGVAGTVAGLVASTSAACCSYTYVEGRGFPFTWLSRGATADSLDAARRATASSGWAVDAVSLVTSAFVWAYAGLVILTLVTLVRRGRARR